MIPDRAVFLIVCLTAIPVLAGLGCGISDKQVTTQTRECAAGKRARPIFNPFGYIAAVTCEQK